MSSLSLIPQPARCEEGIGAFIVREGISIVVSQRAERGEWLAARSVQAVLHEAGITVPIQPQILCPDTAQTIVLAVQGRDDRVFPTAPFPAALAADAAGDEAYALTVDERQIAVWGRSPAGLAHGVQTLCQILAQSAGRVESVQIADAPVLRWRGVMLDVSRGKVPKLETLLRIVDVLAAYKLNMFQLYTEHTFASRRHPKIGQGWGALTPEEIVTLDAYCRDRYIELVPCIQSFGHMFHILELPEYAHLAESDQRWSLAPTLEESYELLNDLYADALACFSSSYINVCSDETYDLGTGKSKEQAQRVGAGRLYLGHILRLHELATRYGKTMMMWGDILLNHPSLLPELPKDVILLNWSYEAAEDYPQVEHYYKAGLQQIVCPGTASWNTLFPRLDNARANIRNFVRAGLRAGTLGILNTDWGDRGHPNLLGGSWYGYVYGAQEGWSPGLLDDTEFERRFALLFFGPREADAVREAFRALTDACTLPGIRRFNGSLSRDMFFGYPPQVRTTEVTAEYFDRIVQIAAYFGAEVPLQARETLAEIARAHSPGAPIAEPPPVAVQMAKAAQERGVDFTAEMVMHMIIQEGTPVADTTLAQMRDLGLRAHELLYNLHGASAEQALTLDEFRLAARQVIHAATKAQAGRQVGRLSEGASDDERAALYRQVVELKHDLHDLRHEYERLWLARNKPEGRWQTLDHIDQAAHGLDELRARVAPSYAQQLV